jgi:hypothetical protein
MLPEVPPNPKSGILPPKRFSPYSFDYGNEKASGRARKILVEEMSKNRYGDGQVRRVHVHLPLHLPYAFGTMVPAHLRARSC